MAEDPDTTPEEDADAAPDAGAEAPVESDVDAEESQEAAISPEDEATGQAAIDAMGFGADDGPISVSELTAASFAGMKPLNEANALNEVMVELSVVLGRATMPINQLLKMGRGAVIELGAQVDDDSIIYANNRMIARGQVVVVGENIAISITDTVQITDS